jgi:hypothetical protein
LPKEEDMSEKKPGFALNPENLLRVENNLFDRGAVDCLNYHELPYHPKKPNALRSPIYLRLRTLDNPGKKGPLTPEDVVDIAELFYDMANSSSIEYDFIVPVPGAVEPFVKEFAKIAGCEDKILHLTQEGEKSMRKVGPLTQESKSRVFPKAVVLLFDVFTSKGESKLEAIIELEDAGLVVEDIIVLVDREQGGSKELADEGYNHYSIFKISSMLTGYFERGRISKEKYIEISIFLAASSG